ncbi:hypothetical protein LR48_Vigan04g099800 [Vigna angularis]|uniref:Uncharacterized protein n=1 Tax=Phaseolus angularis TaxID=3914 RepID=A0A0L9UCZ2_PHAAN|nr:hypothetical protein LR48_Vigan04g099800 [Vigna angularis]
MFYAGFKVNLVKEVKKDRNGIRKDIKKCKKRSRNHRLPLSGTQKLTLAPLRGEKAVEGKKRTRALTAERWVTTNGAMYLKEKPSSWFTSTTLTMMQGPAVQVERKREWLRGLSNKKLVKKREWQLVHLLTLGANPHLLSTRLSSTSTKLLVGM